MDNDIILKIHVDIVGVEPYEYQRQHHSVTLAGLSAWVQRLINTEKELSTTRKVEVNWYIDDVDLRSLQNAVAVLRNEIPVPEQVQKEVKDAIKDRLPELLITWLDNNPDFEGF